MNKLLKSIHPDMRVGAAKKQFWRTAAMNTNKWKSREEAKEMLNELTRHYLPDNADERKELEENGIKCPAIITLIVDHEDAEEDNSNTVINNANLEQLAKASLTLTQIVLNKLRSKGSKVIFATALSRLSMQEVLKDEENED